MARRRTIEIPSSAELAQMETEFRKDGALPRPSPGVAPIAQVAAEAAASHDPRAPDQRVEAARDRADAEALREARARALIMLELPLDSIDADALVRDRTGFDPAEMAELKASIAASGLRLPIEVFPLPAPAPGEPAWGLLSGYRRLMAVRALAREGAAPRSIKALSRAPDAMAGALAAMVEENEIRAGLSHYERGRIAVLAAGQGAWPSTEAAVAGLFPHAPKARRSKIRSFALIFEELGDMLRFAEKLREADGLKLAAALRDGRGPDIREHLALGAPRTPEDEAELIARSLAEKPAKTPDPRRGGRPAKVAGPRLQMASGGLLEAKGDGGDWVIRLAGLQGLSEARIAALLPRLAAWLDAGETPEQ